MPFPMKIQPLDSQTYRDSSIRNDSAKPVLKSRFKRLFDRQFPSVLRISSVEKPIVVTTETHQGKDAGGPEFEPSSVCLAKMVQNFIEETNEKQSAVKCGRNRCNCFNGNNNDSSDDEFEISSGFGDSYPTASSVDNVDALKSLIPCASVVERNLLADTSKIVEKNKISKRKDDLRGIIAENLLVIGYDASICKSRWDKTPSYPAGEYEFIDVIVKGERVLIDIDFRSEFEIARSTGSYKSVLQSLPYIFVGKADRLQQIISIVSEAAKQSLKKKGMHIPPWRKQEYMRAKWLSPHTRTTPPGNDAVEEENSTETEVDERDINKTESKIEQTPTEIECGDLELIFGDTTKMLTQADQEVTTGPLLSPPSPVKIPGDDEKTAIVSSTWQLPAIKPRSYERGAKVVTGLAFLLKEKP